MYNIINNQKFDQVNPSWHVPNKSQQGRSLMIPSQMMKVQCGPEIIGKDKIVNPWNSLQTTYKVLRNETFLLREASHDDKHCPNLIPRLWIFVPRCKLTGKISYQQLFQWGTHLQGTNGAY